MDVDVLPVPEPTIDISGTEDVSREYEDFRVSHSHTNRFTEHYRNIEVGTDKTDLHSNFKGRFPITLPECHWEGGSKQ